MSITLTGAQICILNDFVAPDGTTEQWQCEVTIEEVKGIEHVTDGLWAYITEYPEEGRIYLGT